MKAQRLRAYAVLGAQVRARELETELGEIRGFLGNGHAPRRTRPPMTPAQRAAVSKWMRRYWAKRRKEAK